MPPGASSNLQFPEYSAILLRVQLAAILFKAAFAAALLRKWAKSLPFFTAASVINVAIAITSMMLGSSPTWLHIVGALLHVAATIESFAWFARSMPTFKSFGAVWILAVVTFAALLGLGVEHTMAGASAWRVGFAITIGAISALNWGGFELIGKANDNAGWHAAVLAIAGLGDGVGWLLFDQGLGMTGAWVIFASGLIVPALWMLTVKAGPKWSDPPPAPRLGGSERVDQLWNRIS